MSNLFETLETDKNYPTSIFIGNGKAENGRMLVTLKLTKELKPYFRDGLLSITIFKMKQASKFGHTHSVVVNQNSEWPAESFINRNLLAVATSGNVATITISEDNLKTLAYDVPNKGQYAKFELADNGMQTGFFRWYKDSPVREIAAFKATNKFVTPLKADVKGVSVNAGTKEAQQTTDAFFNDL